MKGRFQGDRPVPGSRNLRIVLLVFFPAVALVALKL